MKKIKGNRPGFAALSLLLIIPVAIVLAGCLSPPPGTKGEQTGWIITVNGVRSESFDQGYFDEAKAHESHYVTRELERKDTLHTYQGMPLRLIAAMADGTDSHHPFEFDGGLWADGYDITLTASDGYSATFSTLEIGPEDLLVADSEDGEPIAPTIVGNVSGKLWVKNLAVIDLGIKQAGMEPDTFELVVEINDEVEQFTLAELEQSPYYVEDKGSYTTSAGTTSTHVYGGVKFADFLQQFFVLEKDINVTMVAMDGYEMSYSGEQILDKSDGEWILAFKSDGEYMPVDPGYIRTIKVGPGVPNIDGHLSVRMIGKIAASGEPFQEFALMMKGKSDADIDAQTFQSCVSCHTTEVSYLNKKSGEEDQYTGVPLWRLSGYSDDELYQPHKQDTSILSYREGAALDGYQVVVKATDGFSITLDSVEINKNNDVIIAMYKNGEPLSERDWPLIIVWDKDAGLVPAGIKSVRNLEEIELLF